MAKGKKKRSAAVNRAAEAVGGALGSIVGRVESLQAQHPHPVEEAREALAVGQEALASVASKAGTGAAAVIKQAKTVARRAKKAVTRARPKKTTAVARVRRTAEKAVRRVKKAITQGRKTARRAAKRLKR